MGIITWIRNWVSFRTMLTPLILKLLYQILFFLLNGISFLGLLVYIAAGAMSVLAAFGKDTNTGIIFLVIALILLAIFVGIILVSNLMLRVYFEIILLLFNMYDSLKEIEKNRQN